MIWHIIAWVVTQPRVFTLLSDYAVLHPYSHIKSADGKDLYMGRWWLFNPYATERGGRTEGSETHDSRVWWRRMLPSVRLHYIARPDRDRHLHDHPWNARTVICRGFYAETRAEGSFVRNEGDTCRLKHGEFHRISHVSHGGVWTIFITWRKRGSWGFDVDGVKVPWREYLAKHSGNVADGRM